MVAESEAVWNFMEDQAENVSRNKRFKTASNAHKLQHLPQGNMTHHFYLELVKICDKMRMF